MIDTFVDIVLFCLIQKDTGQLHSPQVTVSIAVLLLCLYVILLTHTGGFCSISWCVLFQILCTFSLLPPWFQAGGHPGAWRMHPGPHMLLFRFKNQQFL